MPVRPHPGCGLDHRIASVMVTRAVGQFRRAEGRDRRSRDRVRGQNRHHPEANRSMQRTSTR